jgi:curved DNA-binding protein CbpA
MSDDTQRDYYEVLQVNPNADLETIHRVYRYLAQRFHPDNRETGSETRFREIHEAYAVIADPERRARYDIAFERHRKERWRLVSAGESADNDFELEQMVRMTLLEALYTKRRMEPDAPAIFEGDLESLIGRPREQLRFTVWFLQQKKYVTRDDSSRLVITVDGVEHLEQNYRATQRHRRLTSGTGGS